MGVGSGCGWHAMRGEGPKEEVGVRWRGACLEKEKDASRHELRMGCGWQELEQPSEEVACGGEGQQQQRLP